MQEAFVAAEEIASAAAEVAEAEAEAAGLSNGDSEEPEKIIAGGVVSATVVETLVSSGFEPTVLLGGTGGSGLAETFIIQRAFLENPEMAKAKVCGADDLDCVEDDGSF